MDFICGLFIPNIGSQHGAILCVLECVCGAKPHSQFPLRAADFCDATHEFIVVDNTQVLNEKFQFDNFM